MSSRESPGLLICVLAGLAVPISATHADAQWLDYKTPGIPRTADGKPDLAAAAPRTADGKPDFSGVWRTDLDRPADAKPVETAKLQPWAETVAKKRSEGLRKDSPEVLCLPMGPSPGMGVGKVVQTPGLLLMLYDGTLYRQIFLDGRELAKDPNPDWMGYSVGHWDGDTLIVESNGFNDRSWLRSDGAPHTEQLRVTERIRRSDFGHRCWLRGTSPQNTCWTTFSHSNMSATRMSATGLTWSARPPICRALNWSRNFLPNTPGRTNTGIPKAPKSSVRTSLPLPPTAN